MFERRIKIMLLMLAFATGIIIARLFDMQVLNADTYRQQAENALVLNAQILSAVRGRILDRGDGELVSDEPCWDINVHYDVLSINTNSIAKWIKKSDAPDKPNRSATPDEEEIWFRDEIQAMWHALARFSGEPVIDLHERATGTCDRIAQIHREVHARRGFDSPVREERMFHPIIKGLDDQQQVSAQQVVKRWPWANVDNGTRRLIHAGPAFAHVLGRTAAVSAKVQESDPFKDEPGKRYLGTDRYGSTGVERVGEALLRGTRGTFRKNLEGEVLEDVPAQPGRDIHLTIHRALQESIYKLLSERIDPLPFSSGGSVVVLDVETRECLALVSYPGFDPNRFRTDYRKLIQETRRRPLRFRAVWDRYAPGSIVKPLVCIAGVESGSIDLHTQFNCQGAMFPEHPDRFRCWPNSSTGARMQHGPLTVPDAIKHSCNIFMYRTAQLVGVEGLTNWFDMVGFGKTSGTGLAEESSGINPTPSYLAEYHDGVISAGRARNFGIGQGEVTVTPIQAANLMATYASGEYRAVTLVRELADHRAWELPVAPESWRAIRRGLYGVVNDSDGTAHRTAYLEPDQGYVICGKTGSAEVVAPWKLSYAIPYVDEKEREHIAYVKASTKGDAIRSFLRDFPNCAFDHSEVRVASVWPDRPPEHGRRHSHAWFAAYLAPANASGQLIESRIPPIALAVMVEFGGSGGRVSAPIGREIAKLLIEMLGPDLDPDYVPINLETGEPVAELSSATRGGP